MKVRGFNIQASPTEVTVWQEDRIVNSSDSVPAVLLYLVLMELRDMNKEQRKEK